MYVKLVNFLFLHGRPVPRHLLLIKVEVVFEVTVQVVVDITDLRLYDSLEFFVAEAATAVNILLRLLFGL